MKKIFIIVLFLCDFIWPTTHVYAAETFDQLQTRLAAEFTHLPCTPANNANLTITNNTNPSLKLSLGTSSDQAGAITSLKINGQETVNSADHGREIQYAFQVAGGGEDNNPTEAGSTRGGASRFVGGCKSGTELYTKNQMAYWHIRNGKVLSDYFLEKIVTLGIPGQSNVIRFIAKVHSPESVSSIIFEQPTGYHSSSFSTLKLYDPTTGQVRTPLDSEIQHNKYNIFTLFYSGHNIPIISNGTYSLGPYDPVLTGENAYYSWGYIPGNTTKWSLHRYLGNNIKNIAAGKDYYFEAYLVVGKPNSIAADLSKLIGSQPSPTPSINPSLMDGDLNADGKVNIYDYNLLVGNFGKTGSNIVGDIDKNGKVDIFDYNILVGNFGK